MFGLGFSLNLHNERLLNMQCPALSRSRRLIRDAEKIFPLPPPGKNFLKIGKIGERYINVDICGSTFVDFGGATVVDIRGLYWK